MQKPSAPATASTAAIQREIRIVAIAARGRGNTNIAAAIGGSAGHVTSPHNPQSQIAIGRSVKYPHASTRPSANAVGSVSVG